MKRTGFLFFLLLLTSFSAFSQFNMQVNNPVSWNFSTVEKGNGTYDLVFNASIESPWHMYAIELEQTGPIPTTISLVPNSSVRFIGDIKELTKAVVKFDEGFQFNVGAYYKKAGFSQLVSVLSVKPVIIKGTIDYQCCNDETCLPPFQDEFSFSLPGNPAAASATNAENSTPDMNGGNEKPATNAKQEIVNPVVQDMNDRQASMERNTEPEESVAPAQPTIVANPVEAEQQSFWLFLLISFPRRSGGRSYTLRFPNDPDDGVFFYEG